jgi:uncharacterized membrane protein (UPF0182 family)
VAILVAILGIILLSAKTIASTVIDYQWWKEVGQLQVWFSRLAYGVIPHMIAALVAAVVIWAAFARGLAFGGGKLRHHPLLAKWSPLLALLCGAIVTGVTIDEWAVMRYVGSDGAVSGWRDPVFDLPLGFYLFTLPFYKLLQSFVLVTSLVAIGVYWGSARFIQLQAALLEMRASGQMEITSLGLSGGLESRFLRFAGALSLLALAVRLYLARYGLLESEHGFMTGMNWADEHLRLPLLTAVSAASAVAAAALFGGRWKMAVVVIAIPVLLLVVVPNAVSTVYVRPNEINIERPYIQHHIEATRSAFGLSGRVSESEYATNTAARIDITKNRALLDNVRLWDWRAFHDTVTQIQALRPYYVFADTDVDRYTIGGQLRQVMLTPRELDIRQLPDARTRWINPHFIYTHGYGMLMAEANLITPDGLPRFIVHDAPPKIASSGIKLTRPEIYYGEVTHEPVVVRTAQTEFSYPSGNDSVFTRYDGKGGFPLSRFGIRLAAAIRDGDFNLLLTNLLTEDSRMMIHRKVLDRVNEVAGFLDWDRDPYLVVTDEGRLVWTLDGYTTSDSHPYSHFVRWYGYRYINYIRNSVKATVDAYDGTIHVYVADPDDPIIRAYQRLFPTLFEPLSAMPAALRQHLRYAEQLFSTQAQVYRTYHMRDPQAFYNKEDVWDVAKRVVQKDQGAELTPSFMVATLPGEEIPEFLLVLPFTPRGKDNLIGLMVARNDGDKLGELRFLQLSKQALIFGPMQVDARIDQDPEISKDLSLWNQQGSQVVRGQMVVLPIQNNVLYIESIYLQSAQARMPQLKKVVVAVGNDIVYRNTYEEAIAAIGGLGTGPPPAKAAASGPVAEQATGAGQADGDRRLSEIRQRLRRYRELWSQGQYAAAGKELEAIEALAK